LWIGTKGNGLLKFKDGAFTLWTTQAGLPDNFVRALYEAKDGSLWLGTEGGLTQFKDGRFKTYTTRDGLSHNTVWSITADHDGALWVGTVHGLNQLANGSFRVYDKSRSELPRDFVRPVHQDRRGNVWIGMVGGGLARLSNGRLTTFTTKDGLADNNVWSIAEDRDGNLWVATLGGGVSRLREGRFESLITRHGLPSNRVLAVCEDREGSLWLGTGDGLVQLRDGNLLTYTTQQGLSHDTVKAVYAARDGSVMIGTFGGGLNRWHNGVVSSAPGQSNELVLAIAEDQRGGLWVGTENGGLKHFHNGCWRVYTMGDSLPDNSVKAILADRDGSFWFGTGAGLSHFADGRFRNFTRRDGLVHASIRALHQDRAGRLWIGTEGGVQRLDGNQFTTYTTNDGLAANYTLTFYEDTDGVLWIGASDGGLTRYHDGQFKSITRRDGLFDDNLSVILEDAQNNLWFGCDRGIFKVSKQELNDFARGAIRRVNTQAFTSEDGMTTSQMSSGSQPAGCRTRDGRLWFASVRGAVVIDPQRLATNTLAPPVFIEQVIANGQPVAATNHIEIAPGDGDLEIYYTALSFAAPDKVHFKYQLTGYDHEWVEAGARREAFYTNLPPGAYQFKVIASNNDGRWNETGVTLALKLAPQFYQTGWFYLFCAAAVAMAGLGVHRLKVRQVRARFAAVFAERNRIARELHDTVEQGLAMLISQLDWGRQALREEPAQAERHLEFASNLAKHHLDETKRYVWDLHDEELEKGDLATALAQAAQRLTEGTPIKAEIKVKGTISSLPALTGHHLLRIGQEAIANAVKHARAARLEVSLKFEPRKVELCVRDDGCGFDSKQPARNEGSHFGLVAIRERVEKIGGELKLLSQPGQGTEVIVNAPLPRSSAS
jgi:signal transduction histidine kinase/sugar lactone lactonase YvrE